MLHRNPIDLLNLCKRVLAEWQYYSLNLQYEKLVSVQTDCRYEDPKVTVSSETESSPTASVASVSASASRVEQLKCTKFTVVADMTAKGNEISTVKNFFNNVMEPLYSFKEKEKIYWGVRLRHMNSCPLYLCIVVLKLGSRLEAMGYTGWKLPNGQVVPFCNLWFGELAVIPSNLYMIRTMIKFGAPTISDRVDPFDTCRIGNFDLPSGTHLNLFAHGVLVARCISGRRATYLIDPASMQFGFAGPLDSGLIMHGTKEEYGDQFPGVIYCSNLDYDPNRIRTRLYDALQIDSDNNLPHPVQSLMESVLEKLNEDCCFYCGEIERVGNNIKEIELCLCSNCRYAKYCDSLCQTADWPEHRFNCKPFNGTN